MKVVRPMPIGSPALISSSVPEDVADYPEWSASTSYPNGAVVRRSATHRRYASVVAGNAGHPPESSPTQWTDIGPTNRWAMFDRTVGTLTTSTGAIVIELQPGAIGALAVLDTDAETVDVEIVVDNAVVYSQSRATNVSGDVIDDWEDYFLTDIGKVMTTLFLDLPRYVAGRVRVTITGNDANGPVSVGTLLVGRTIDLGSTEIGPSIGITDFSRKETDQYGVTDVVERSWAKRATIRSMLPTRAVDGVQRDLASLRARPALWIGEEGFDSLTIYGFFKDFSVDLALPNISYCSLTIEGLI